MDKAEFVAELLRVIRQGVPPRGVLHPDPVTWVTWQNDLLRAQAEDVHALKLMAYRFFIELTPFVTMESWEDSHAGVLHRLIHARSLHEVEMEVLSVGLEHLNRDRIIKFAQCS